MSAVDTNLYQKMHCTANLRLFDYFSVTFTFDIFKKTAQKPCLYLWVQNYMVFELTHLHVLDWLQLNFRHIVFIHVKQDILNHDYTEFLIGPKSI